MKSGSTTSTVAVLAPVVAIIALSVWPLTAHARTWRVAKDGSGDSIVIQDAVDASYELDPAGKDTILIGPGHYFDAQFVEESGAVDSTAVLIRQVNLTLIGSGADQTIIGQESHDPEDNGIVAGEYFGSDGILRVQDIGFLNWGIGIRADVMHWRSVTGCTFEATDTGVLALGAGNVTVRSCEFSGMPDSGVYAHSNDAVEISECDIGLSDSTARGVVLAFAAEASIVGCRIENGGFAVHVSHSHSVDIRNCEFCGQLQNQLPSVTCWHSQLNIGDSVVRDAYWGLGCFDGAEVVVRGVRFNDIVSASTVLNEYVSSISIQECDLSAGVDGAVVCFAGYLDDPWHADFTYNNWGTSDPEDIPDLIWDRVDNPDIAITVDWYPFQGGVEVMPLSWSQLRRQFQE